MRKTENKSKVKRVVHVFIITLLFLTFIFDLSIRPIIKQIGKTASSNIISDLVSSSVTSALKKINTGDEMVTIEYTSDGIISSVVCNTAMINAISSRLTAEINNSLCSISDTSYKVRTGTLTGNAWLNGKGINVPFRLSHIGYPEISYTSEFESAGINQTKHRIVMHITVNVNTVVFPYKEVNEYKYDFIVSEIIIVGKVPDSYTNISGDDRDVISKINDY